MPHFDQETSECLVLTFKEGLLSKVAHDLKLRVGVFSVDVEQAPGRALQLRARFEAPSLKVVCAMKGGQEAPASLTAKDREEIDRSIAEQVLQAGRHPEIRFESRSVTAEGGGFKVEGTLTLHGVSRPLGFRVNSAKGRHTAEVPLEQTDFGIKPYRALMGTLKIKSGVVVRISVPATE
jgi:hypothetical protein